jgi:ABC-type multidrug transport system fused ATPase/permease subunit
VPPTPQAVERQQRRVLSLSGVALVLVLLVLLPWVAALRTAFYSPAARTSSPHSQLSARQQQVDRLHEVVDGMRYHELEARLSEGSCPGAGLAATVPEMRELLKICLTEAKRLETPPPPSPLPAGGECAAPAPDGGQVPVYIDFAQVNVSVPGKVLLHAGVRGCVGAGQVTAIMGGSGSGKTTLVSVLRGVSEHDKVVQGVAAINGGPYHPIGPALRRLRADWGYVPQNDVMYR